MRSAAEWCAEPDVKFAPGRPEAPPIVAPDREVRTAETDAPAITTMRHPKPNVGGCVQMITGDPDRRRHRSHAVRLSHAAGQASV
jgi:hypothetical protein